MPEQKQRFGFQYWFNQLIEIGKLIEPTKYTPDYVNFMRGKWVGVGISKLHQKVLQRKAELNK